MELVAHRGFAAEAPENTIPALTRAAEIADAVEFDVRRCGSGEPVVVHDATVDRVTDRSGPVASYAAAELAGMDVLGSGAGIPTLAAVLEALPDDAALFVELKESGLAERVLDALADHGGPATIIAFDPATLRAVRELDDAVDGTGSGAVDGPASGSPDGSASGSDGGTVDTAYLAGRLRDRPVSTAVACDCTAVDVRARLAALPRIREAARALGLDLYVWTVTNRPMVRLLDHLGVDGVTSDRSDLLERTGP